MPRTAQVGSLDLEQAPFKVAGGEYEPKLPDARLNDFGRAAQMAGAFPYEAHYEEPSWEISVIVDPATREDVDTLTAAFRPGAILRWGEDTGTASCRITTVEPAQYVDHGDVVIVTFSGTRRPAWETTSYDFSGSVAPGDAVFTLPDVSGEVGAKMSITAISSYVWSTMGIGVQPDPGPQFSPLDDYSGTVESGAIGGQVDTLTMTSSFATIEPTPTLDVNDNRGSWYCIGYVKSNAATGSNVKWRVGSSIAGSSIYSPLVSAWATNYTHLPMGVVRIPAYEIPSTTAGSSWVATTGISQTNGSNVVSPEFVGDRYAWQGFTLANDRKVTRVQLKVNNASGSTQQMGMSIRTPNPYNGGLDPNYGDSLQYVTASVPVGTGVIVTFNFDVELAAGDYFLSWLGRNITYWRDASAPYTGGVGGHISAGGSHVAGDGTDTTIDWYFNISLAERVYFDAQVPVQALCSESSKVATIDALVRVPMDHGGMVIFNQSNYSADTGITYDPDLKQVFPVDSTGAVTGNSLGTKTTLFGTEFAPIPNVANELVVWGSVNAIAISGTITERRIHRG